MVIKAQEAVNPDSLLSGISQNIDIPFSAKAIAQNISATQDSTVTQAQALDVDTT